MLPEAKQAEVARILRGVLEAQGTLLDEQTGSRIVFEGWRMPGGFARGGYVGAYQPVGEKGVEVLLQAWATGPRRAFWAVVVLDLVLVPVMFVLSPPSAVFFLASLVLWGLLLVAALLYYLTRRGSRQVEAALYTATLDACRAEGLVPLDEEALLEQRIRDRLEGEVKERELAAMPPPPAAPRLGLGRGKPRPSPPPKERKGGLFGRRKEL